MSPGMTGKNPTLSFHSICHCLCSCTLCIQIKLRMCIQPGFLIIIQIIRSGLITDICTVSKDPVISSKCNNAFGSMIGKIRMRFNKTVDQGNHIIIPHRDTPVILHVFIPNPAISIYYQFCSDPVSILRMIITHIIL